MKCSGFFRQRCIDLFYSFPLKYTEVIHEVSLDKVPYVS